MYISKAIIRYADFLHTYPYNLYELFLYHLKSVKSEKVILVTITRRRYNFKYKNSISINYNYDIRVKGSKAVHACTIKLFLNQGPARHEVNIMYLKRALLPLISVCFLLSSVCSASEGEGMLSPSSESTDSVFGSSSSAEPVTDEKLQSLLDQLQVKLPTGNGNWSLYICDLFNESEGGLNTDSMQAASLIKLYIMGAVYENYDSVIRQYSKESVDSSLYSMITVSDNDAANTLVSYLGGGNSTAGMQAVNSFCQAHDYTKTSMGRLLLADNTQGDNYTSTDDCAHFLQEIYEEEDSDYPHASDMYTLLKAQTRRNKIPAQLPQDVKTANKTGELSNVENDAGIIYDSENDLVIVFMSQNLSDTSAAQNTIASLSREIYDYYN